MAEHTTHSEVSQGHHEVGPWQILVESDLLNVLILALAIVYLGNKFLPKMADERKKQISKELENAKAAGKKAETELMEIKEKCKNISREIESIKEEAQKTALGMKKRIEEETETEIERIRIKAKREINSVQDEAIQNIQKSASDAAIKMAEEALVKISQNPEVQDQLVEDFLDEIDNPSNN